jgi:biotin transport system substrate-specific component
LEYYNQRTLAERFLILAIANLLLIACAQIRIPLPFTPVPITGQTFGVLFTGALLGSRYGTLVVIAYVVQGLTGLPVFAGLNGGIAVLFGPTGGYILGFIPAAFVVGWLLYCPGLPSLWVGIKSCKWDFCLSCPAIC